MSNENKPHYVNVGANGTFAPSGQNKISPKQIDAIFEHLAKERQSHLAIYFHGGLVSEQSGRITADALIPRFDNNGIYPVFFIWETGIFETVRDNLTLLMQTDFAHKILIYVLKQVAKRWGVDILGKGAGQSIIDDEIETELLKDQPFNAWDKAEYQAKTDSFARGGALPLDESDLELQIPFIEAELYNDINADSESINDALRAVAHIELLKPELRLQSENAGAKGIDPATIAVITQLVIKVTIAVLKRKVQGIDHGLYPTVIEELIREVGINEVGKFLWDGMKLKAEQMWLPNPDSITPGNITDAHVGTYFIEKMIEYAKAHPGLNVDLIGHSAGSITICKLLDAVTSMQSDFKFRRIVFLAPAARMDLFHKNIVLKQKKFENFRMFTMLDQFERVDAIAGPIYPRSLLYFVSGVLEDKPATPIVGLARCFNGIKPYDEKYILEIVAYLNTAKEDRLVCSITDQFAHEDMLSSAIHHGDFSGDAATIKSVLAFLK